MSSIVGYGAYVNTEHFIEIPLTEYWLNSPRKGEFVKYIGDTVLILAEDEVRANAVWIFLSEELKDCPDEKSFEDFLYEKSINEKYS